MHAWLVESCAPAGAQSTHGGRFSKNVTDKSTFGASDGVVWLVVIALMLMIDTPIHSSHSSQRALNNDCAV